MKNFCEYILNRYELSLKNTLKQFKILASDSKEINLFYSESLLILKQKLSLNKMQTSININLFT